MKRVLVTGGAGFIGSHVVETLLERGDQVVILDNIDDYYAPSRKRQRVDEVAARAGDAERFVVVEGDIRDRSLLVRLCQRYQFDAVVHLAAMAGVRASIERPELYFDVNLSGTLAVLHAVRDHTNATVVLASTSSVYGNTARIPFVESDPCDRPLSPYSASKRAAELLAATWHHLYRVDITVLRFFTVYGPGNRPDMMAYKILDSVATGREVPLFNGGQMKRDWTYVKDIAAGVVAAVDRPNGYQVLNLGRGQPVLLSEFVSAIECLAGKQANLVPAPAPDTDMKCTYADISLAREKLGYDPQVSVTLGVQCLWEWYIQSLESTAM